MDLCTAHEPGISAELLHRVAVLAPRGTDTLPHCGAIITLLAICKLTHKQSSPHVAAFTTVFSVTALIAVITLGPVFGSFYVEAGVDAPCPL